MAWSDPPASGATSVPVNYNAGGIAVVQRLDPDPEEQARILKAIDCARADGFVSARPFAREELVRAASIWLRAGALQARISEEYPLFPGAFLVLSRDGQPGFRPGQYILAPAIQMAGKQLFALIVFVRAANYDKAKASASPFLTLVGLEWDRMFQE